MNNYVNHFNIYKNPSYFSFPNFHPFCWVLIVIFQTLFPIFQVIQEFFHIFFLIISFSNIFVQSVGFNALIVLSKILLPYFNIFQKIFKLFFRLPPFPNFHPFTFLHTSFVFLQAIFFLLLMLTLWLRQGQGQGKDTAESKDYLHDCRSWIF